MSKVEIYYFSGTGNSLHLARELQKRIPETKLIPITSNWTLGFDKTILTLVLYSNKLKSSQVKIQSLSTTII